MKKSNTKDTVLLSLTIFSMFFGAGNLIFAPYLGAQAGSSAWLALAGFVITAVVIPISAILIISRYKSAQDMIGTINKPFAAVFLALIYLLIGPCIAIPRTASLSFEMFDWLFSSSLMARLIYTLIFFAAASLTAYKPGRLKDILGKVMGPILLILIVSVCIGASFQTGSISAPSSTYSRSPFFVGFDQGYQTMDILAAYCFGIIIMMNIKQMHLSSAKEENALFVKASILAGVFLASIYTMLAFTGMSHSGTLSLLSNGAQILSTLSLQVFGEAGQWINSLIFLIACFNVCSGLLSCCSAYFHELFPKISYRIWLAAFAIAGAVAASFGLDAILALSAPVLSFICPIAVILLIYGLTRSILVEKGILKKEKIKTPAAKA
jgi:LIVCS family branched-chain amino acid:cation transporter